MTDQYPQELYTINQKILKMGILVEENLRLAGQALVNQDESLAREVIERDKLVNSMELEIGDQCTNWIAREKPTDSDLRHIVACLKVISDVERIGDYASHIAKRAKALASETYIKPLLDMPRMIVLGAEMLREALEAFIQRNQDLARTVALRDSEMNDLNKKVYRDLLECMAQNPLALHQATRLLILSRELERVGDHTVYICSWTIYSVTGKHEDLS